MKRHFKNKRSISELEINSGSNLNVAAAHVVLVALQGKVPVLRVDETNQCLAVPPALSVKTQSHTTPETQKHSYMPEGWGIKLEKGLVLFERFVINDSIKDIITVAD